MIKLVIAMCALFSIGLVSGCASGPTFKEYAEKITPVEKGKARIYIYRTAVIGAAIQPSVRLNDEVVGSAKPQGFFYVDRPAGDYVISTSTEAKRSLSLRLEPGDEKYVRLEMKFGLFAGHVKPVLVNPAVGKDEIKETKYTGGKE